MSSLFSLSGESLRQRGVPTRESLFPNNSATTRESTTTTRESSQSQEEEDKESLFECNICLDTASIPVISLCGHLYCWPCIYQWMVSNVPGSKTCPVCKSVLDTKDKLIPIYTRGRTKDPREDIPSRPNAQRQEPTPTTNTFGNIFQGLHFNTGNVVFHFGTFGLVPLAIQMAINSGFFQSNNPTPMNPMNNQNQMNANNGLNDNDESSRQLRGFISRMLFMMGILLILVIVLY